MLDHVTCPGSSLPLSNMAYDKVLALSKSNGKMDFYVAQMMQQWYNDPNKHLAILHYLQLLCHCESLSEMGFFLVNIAQVTTKINLLIVHVSLFCHFTLSRCFV